jgi:hypothetical protein
MRLRCPHCDYLGAIRTSTVLSQTVTQHYVQCNNHECGHTWRATTEADMTLSPSATPDPAVSLPLSSHVRRDLIAQQVRSGITADYTPRLTPPSTRDLFQPADAGGPS